MARMARRRALGEELRRSEASVSYDIYCVIDTGGPEPVSVGESWNYTSNCVRMWCEAGIDLAECHGRDAGGCAEGLEAAIHNLKSNPEKFIAMNPPNGWGSYESLVPALEKLLSIWLANPKAIVEVSR